jgi:hypothetical protein
LVEVLRSTAKGLVQIDDFLSGMKPSKQTEIEIAGVGNVKVDGNSLDELDSKVLEAFKNKGSLNNNSNLSGAAKFEQDISKLPAGERVAQIRIKADEVAKDAGLVRAKNIESLNSGRRIYQDPKTKMYYSVDTQHGRFELLDKRGKHLGEVDMDLNFKGKTDNSGGHDIKIK